MRPRTGARADEATRLDAVIFDLDGVLTDTAEFHERGWARLADEQGWHFDSALADELRGVSRMDSLERILAENGVTADVEQKREWADRKNRYYVDALDELSPADLLPGALELVLACKDEGLAVAIGSSSRNAPMVLDRLGITDQFAAVSDGNAVERAKPAPDLFLHAADQLGVAAERCVVVEDAASGVDAALAAGMVTVGVGPAERLGHAHHRFDTVAEIDLDRILDPEGAGS
ncbi:beta-phosphoglucomutase [Egibacter rhizosphaerae]|uniref:Beta-phosphoglucomutase n=1 Tax=Egibacter rhizosphaerae TaxID=1670831 RepID=A0A411YIQ6_9ACTN|nr:beta-phosphoglucomutase [Egibacter rhizosphaerae]QBI20966.1 beta-phosphoglucomutase [Egibacter rhizosphaerae]